MGRKAGELLVLGILKSLKKQSEKLIKGMWERKECYTRKCLLHVAEKK